MKILKSFGLTCLYWVCRWAISLRYSLDVEGLEEMMKEKKRGLLFLPNHPAEMDPVILMVLLWPHFRPRPLVVEHFYYITGIHFFMRLVRALPLPTMDFANAWKVRQVEKLKEKILGKLDQGENFLIYPSGKLKLTPDERLGGASLVPEIITASPDASLVLVRTSGLWGSIFSRALSNSPIDFGKNMLKGFFLILQNLIFFAPRRKVKIEFTFAPEDFPRHGSKIEINRYLERWFNKRGPEELTLVSHVFWRKAFPKIERREAEEVQDVEVPHEVRHAIFEQLAKMTSYTVGEIDAKAHLSNDLGLDSIDAAQLYLFLEDQFGISGLVPGQLQTVADILKAAAGERREKELPPVKKKIRWPKEKSRPDLAIPDAETIPEAFLMKCDEMGKRIACADNLSGTLSYKRVKKGALVLSERIRKMPGDQIGIMLPSTAGAYVVVLATMLAGKVPVMMNWTAGYRSLEHAAQVTNVQVVLSSFRFLSQLDDGDFGKVDDLLVYLEKIRRDLTLGEKLKGVYRSFFSAKSLVKRLKLPTNGDEKAVVIFTSGTESLPKGVPLSHQNILSDQRHALKVVNLVPTDILYGVLPPFHSFGLSVTGLLPLVTGLKVVYAPDPTDSKAMARDIQRYRVSLLCCAPSFILSLWKAASQEQLASLNIVVSGAEKAPDELLRLMARDKKRFLEGYGITECSPIVTLYREGEKRVGVGRPLDCVELCVIDSETNIPLSVGTEGEVCIRGPIVFSGYLGSDLNPFVEIDGVQWYRSGDRGFLDENGNLTLTGRLKRFTKIGGEMVSLGGLEEDILAICLEKKWLDIDPSKGPPLAVSVRGRESEKPALILFSTQSIDLNELNRALREKGGARLVKLAEVRRIVEIPLTGTGKVHYRALDEME